jgi:hypothetical protein
VITHLICDNLTQGVESLWHELVGNQSTGDLDPTMLLDSHEESIDPTEDTESDEKEDGVSLIDFPVDGSIT